MNSSTANLTTQRRGLPIARICKLILLGCTVVVLVLAIAIGSMIRNGQDLAKWRNSLVYSLRTADVYDWSPGAQPTDYLKESLPPPKDVVEAAAKFTSNAPANSSFETALQLARNLVQNRKSDDPIQGTVSEALHGIISDGTGYCVDYSQAFNGIALAAGLNVRDWGMSFDGYGGDGHAFNEIYDSKLGKWIFIDAYNSFYVEIDGAPASVQQLRETLRNGALDRLTVRHIEPKKFGFKTEIQALEYYKRGAAQMYLWWGDNVFTYDQNAAVASMGKISRATEQMTAIVFGMQPKLILADNHYDSEALARLRLMRWTLITIAACSLMAVCAGLVLLGMRLRSAGTTT